MRDFSLSDELYRRSQNHLAGGVSTAMRADVRPVPLFMSKGVGPRMWDVDGNEYIDYMLGFGPSILGHGHPAVVEAIARQLALGLTYGAQHELEPRVAERICSMVPGAEMVVFSTTGTEAVQVALRLARAFTGRTRFIKFEGHYHGWFDNVLISYRGDPADMGPRNRPKPILSSAGQRADAVDESFILPWNDLDLVEDLLVRHPSEVAAILTEPIMFNSGGIMPRPGYLEGLRALADRFGCLLIFDEVITGFRVAPGGAQELLNVLPDLAVLGKALGGGMPVSGVAGRRDVMDLVARREVVHAGTSNGNPVALAAADATLSILDEDGGAMLKRIGQTGDRLRHELVALLRRQGYQVTTSGVGAAFTLLFGMDTAPVDYREYAACDWNTLARFNESIIRAGVVSLPRGMWYVSAAHGDRDVDDTLARIGTIGGSPESLTVGTAR